MSATQRNDARAISVDPSLGEVLRQQTLVVLEANHEPFDRVLELPDSQLLTVAVVWRDAFTVLDAVGWLPTSADAPVEVVMTAGHVAQLRGLRRDQAEAIVDRLERRDVSQAADEVARLDAEIRRLRKTAWGLGELLARYVCAPGV